MSDSVPASADHGYNPYDSATRLPRLDSIDLPQATLISDLLSTALDARLDVQHAAAELERARARLAAATDALSAAQRVAA